MDNYEEEFLQEIVEKIDSGTEISEYDLKELACEFSDVVWEGENRRWLRSVKSVFEFDGRFFIIEWEEPLTEMQEAEFYNQPYEVEKVTTQKTIDVIEYKKI